MTKHEYICQIAETVAAKSNCGKRKVGAVFVNEDYEILATGYNAPPKGFPHCDRMDHRLSAPAWYNRDGTCGNPCTRNIHAEMNAIVQAAKRGTALKGSHIYCTYTPCVDCARMLINLGVGTVLVKEDNIDGGLDVLLQAKITVVRWMDIP